MSDDAESLGPSRCPHWAHPPSWRVLVGGLSFLLLWCALRMVHRQLGGGWITGAFLFFLPGSLAAAAVHAATPDRPREQALLSAAYGCLFAVLAITRFLNDIAVPMYYWSSLGTNLAAAVFMANSTALRPVDPQPAAVVPPASAADDGVDPP